MSEEKNDMPQQEPGEDAQVGSQATEVKIDDSTMRDAVIGPGGSINYHGISAEQLANILEKQDQAHLKLFNQLLDRMGTVKGNTGKTVNIGQEFSQTFSAEYEEVSTEKETAAAASSIEEEAELPETLEEIEAWYYDTINSDYERYFVQALAALYGTPFGDVSKAAWDLWKFYNDEEKLTSLRRRELLNHVCATTRRVNLVDRTFWRNKDIQAQQDFTLRLLHFLADETAVSSHDSRLADILCQWAETLSGECSRKAAYAAGVLLYYQSADELWRKANAWADSTVAKQNYLAASVLNGAYDVDKLENPQTANDMQKSPVFRLLNQWVERAERNLNPRVGSAAAHAYRLMSRKTPDIALVGLESLLCFPESRARADWQGITVRVWVESISAYIGIAWSGQIRQVLKHLANYARMLIYQPQRPKRADEWEAYENRRKLNLEAVFDIFIFIAISSLDSVQEGESDRYRQLEALPEQPALPESDGRDVLLAGILAAKEARWRNHLLVLFCAAIFAGREREAFFFLGEWADILSKDIDGPDEAIESYTQFLVNIGRTTQAWESELTEKRLKPCRAFHRFAYQLGLWKSKKNRVPLVDAALEALRD